MADFDHSAHLSSVNNAFANLQKAGANSGSGSTAPSAELDKAAKGLGDAVNSVVTWFEEVTGLKFSKTHSILDTFSTQGLLPDLSEISLFGLFKDTHGLVPVAAVTQRMQREIPHHQYDLHNIWAAGGAHVEGVHIEGLRIEPATHIEAPPGTGSASRGSGGMDIA